jgi:hypothetical protein
MRAMVPEMIAIAAESVEEVLQGDGVMLSHCSCQGLGRGALGQLSPGVKARLKLCKAANHRVIFNHHFHVISSRDSPDLLMKFYAFKCHHSESTML